MKLLFAFLTLSSLLLLFAGGIDGRKELGEYWKKVMKEQPIPDVIQDLVDDADAQNYKDNNINAKSSASDYWNKIPFYHEATQTKEEKPSSNDESRHCDDVEQSEQAKFAKD